MLWQVDIKYFFILTKLLWYPFDIEETVSGDTCKVSPEFEFKFKQKFLLNFLVIITFSKPALFSGDFFYKSGKTEVIIWIFNLHFSEMHDVGNQQGYNQ